MHYSLSVEEEVFCDYQIFGKVILQNNVWFIMIYILLKIIFSLSVFHNYVLSINFLLLN